MSAHCPGDAFAIRFSSCHCFPCTSVPSVALHVVEFTFARGFESYLRSHSFNGLALFALCLRSVARKGKLSYSAARGSHLIRYNIAVNIECGSDVRVAHHFLLHGHGSAHSVEP